MHIYEFTCDARVSRQFQAETEADAQKQWDIFCNAMNHSDDFAAQGTDAGQFHVSLLDGEPDIEQCE